MHTIESIGFYFPTLEVVYIGDSVSPVIPVIHKPLTVIYDGLYEHIDCDAPTPKESCSIIQSAMIAYSCPVLQLVHHGILSFLHSCRTRFRLDPSVPPLLQKTAIYLGLVDEKSPYLLVGRLYTDTARVIPSSYWFMRQLPHIDLFEPHLDGNNIRVFCTLHALARDTKRWKESNPYVHFELLSTNPI
jgi:hypothetical protein